MRARARVRVKGDGRGLVGRVRGIAWFESERGEVGELGQPHARAVAAEVLVVSGWQQPCEDLDDLDASAGSY